MHIVSNLPSSDSHLSCYLASSTYTRVNHRYIEYNRTCHLNKVPITRVSIACGHLEHHTRLTSANPHVWYNALHTCIPMPRVQLQSHTLSHLHHAPSGACAHYHISHTHIYTVMCKLIMTKIGPRQGDGSVRECTSL